MTDFPIRLFASDAAVRRVGLGLLDRTLPKEDWTHEAHLATCLWLIDERPAFVPERDLPDAIRSYNAAVGGVNDDTQGYHETITQLYIRAIRDFADRCDEAGPMQRANALVSSAIAARDWPLRFFSRERLFSVAARRGWVEPDLATIGD